MSADIDSPPGVSLGAATRRISGLRSLAVKGGNTLSSTQQDTQSMGGKMDISKTFRMSEEFAGWLAKQVFDLDTDLASLIRTSLLLSIPLIKECPSLLDGRVTLADFKSRQD